MRTKNERRYKWLLMERKHTRDPRVPDWGKSEDKYRIVRTVGTADPYLGFKLIAAFDTHEEAQAMRKLLD